MADFDVIIVGSGINSLTCGALLARAGLKVGLLERSHYFGGAIRTEEVTAPGYLSDMYSAWYPLFTGGGAYQALKADLDARGLTFITAPLSTATLYKDGSAAVMGLDGAANVAEFERHSPGDGQAWGQFLGEFSPNLDLIFGLLGGPLTGAAGEALLQRARERLGPDGLLALGGSLLESARDWLTRDFASDKVRGIFAPWVAHTGMGPEAALSGMMMKVFGITLQFAGLPLPVGGGRQVVSALLDIITANGGAAHTDKDVAEVLVEGGHAKGVRLANGDVITAAKAVVANVTPTQLYGRLLAGSQSQVPAAQVQAARNFRYGPACLQIHLALKEAPQWVGDPRLASSPILMINGEQNQVSKAWNEGVRGVLPEEPIICLGQPSMVDPSRAPAGGATLMVQILGLPNRPVADAAGRIQVGDGTWTEALAERYTERVLKQVARHAPNLPAAVVGQAVVSPAHLEKVNINLVGGDPYGGSLEIAQHYLWRPLPGNPRHATAVPGLYQIGASTFPGHGLGGGSGLLVANELLGQ
ncbi:MAG: FAD-dependent oxidoreductase [Symbiobacteriaceae bacterium]|jgi:phytoene dehydrogenase-like protein|nr:FAD-dependent oxidoreductase [Symbiobacteriaceae bacterium]